MFDKIKKGSILRKMIFLNTLNIFIVVMAILFIVIVFIFNEFEKNLISETEVSIKTFSNVFRNMQEELSKKAVKYSKDRDVIMAVTNFVMKEDIYEEKKESLGNNKILYSYVYTDISGNTKYSMKRLANILIDYITGSGRRYGVNELFLTLIDANGKNLGTSMLVSDQKPFDIEDNSPFVNSILNINNPFKNVITDVYYEVEAKDDGMVVRGGTALLYEKESMGAIVISQVIEKEMVNYISSQIKMKKGTNIFFLKENKFLVGDLDLKKGFVMFDKETAAKKMKGKDYFWDELKIGGERFVAGYHAIRNIHGEIIGYMGIANSKSEINKMKFITIIIIASVSALIMLIGVVLNTIISYRIAKPLMKLQETANRIAVGRYGEVFEKTKESNEISELSGSLQNMLNKINDNVRKIKAIGDMVSIIHSESDEEKVIFYILSVLVSKKGLNCNRAAYFEYDESANKITGKSYSSSAMVDGKEKSFGEIYESEGISINQFKNKIKDISINVESNKVLSDVLTSKKVMYADFDNIKIMEIKDIGFSSMFIIPVIYENNTYGLIFIESNTENSDVFDEDSNIINMFTTNLAIYFENKRLGNENLKTEKLTTMIQMATSIVHELRTPITSIRGFADMLSKSYLTDNKIQRYTEFIIKDSRRIDSLAEDLIEYADGTREKLNLEKIELKKIVNDILFELKGEITANNIVVEIDIAGDIEIYIDEIKFKKAIYNIIKNSIEASKGINDRIVIKGIMESNKIFLKIIDNGIGIPKEIVDTIFEPLVTTKIQGTGLGLTISKEILISHGFTLGIKSEKNAGTEITIVMK